MKVLWITNSPFPEINEKLKRGAPVTTGWVHSSAKAFLKHRKDIKLAVASVYEGDKKFVLNVDGVVHFVLPSKASQGNLNNLWKQIKSDFNPDIIHIHGSEYPYYYSFIKACGAEKVVVSIQGLISVILRYYFGGINRKELWKSVTIRDLVRWDTIFKQYNNMQKRAKYEKLLFKSVKHVIGRTSWDKAHIWVLNPDANYHFCNETLRQPFYENEWTINNCERHSIFLSQAHYALKGIQQLIKALPIVLKYFPETKIYVAGNNFFTNKGMRINGFGNYINSEIKKLGLSEHIFFTGMLNGKEMCKQFLSSHIFINPSSIENSPNSVGEAQILGVPCIASYVGGTPDMIENGKNGLLYRFEEYEMLASHICKLFSDDNLTSTISECARASAMLRHNKQKNAADLYEVYKKIAD